MQCILTQKWPKQPKEEIFPDATLPFSDPKQLSPDSDQVSDISDVRFQRKCPKTCFLAKNGQKWQKLAIFGQNLENENFSKIRLEHFFRLIKM